MTAIGTSPIHKVIRTPSNDSLNNDLLALTLTALAITSGPGSKVSTDLLINKSIECQHVNSERPPLPEITIDEVANHYSPCDCWIIIYDRVYDVTKFLDDHPGGCDIILEYAGRDASIAFRGTGHSKIALLSLKQFEIGELPLAERMFRCPGLFSSKDLPE